MKWFKVYYRMPGNSDYMYQHCRGSNKQEAQENLIADWPEAYDIVAKLTTAKIMSEVPL